MYLNELRSYLLGEAGDPFSSRPPSLTMPGWRSIMGADEVKAFLSHLATQMNVAASTQNQAFSALLFLYQQVLKTRLPWIDDIVRVKRPRKLPVV